MPPKMSVSSESFDDTLDGLWSLSRQLCPERPLYSPYNVSSQNPLNMDEEPDDEEPDDEEDQEEGVQVEAEGRHVRDMEDVEHDDSESDDEGEGEGGDEGEDDSEGVLWADIERTQAIMKENAQLIRVAGAVAQEQWNKIMQMIGQFRDRSKISKRAASSTPSPEEDTEQRHDDADGGSRTGRPRKKLRFDERNEDDHEEEDDDAGDSADDVPTARSRARQGTCTSPAQHHTSDSDDDDIDDEEEEDCRSARSSAPDGGEEDDDALSYASPEREPEERVASTAPMSRKEQVRYLMNLKKQREEQEHRN